VGHHSWDHPRLTELEPAEIASQLRRTTAAIESVTGVRPEVFRPPYGDRDERVDRIAAELGMRTVLWDVDPEDWSRPGVEAIAAAIRGAGPRDVVLLHDGRATGPRRSRRSAWPSPVSGAGPPRAGSRPAGAPGAGA
jgi:peptidoglycan/xylan/chitin deacetylase (PgdA/CDA1 family)